MTCMAISNCSSLFCYNNNNTGFVFQKMTPGFIFHLWNFKKQSHLQSAYFIVEIWAEWHTFSRDKGVKMPVGPPKVKLSTLLGHAHEEATLQFVTINRNCTHMSTVCVMGAPQISNLYIELVWTISILYLTSSSLYNLNISNVGQCSKCTW